MTVRGQDNGYIWLNVMGPDYSVQEFLQEFGHRPRSQWDHDLQTAAYRAGIDHQMSLEELDQLLDYINYQQTVNPYPLTELWTTPALPHHYVAQRADWPGQWLLPIEPIGDNWHAATPYHGNYTLRRAASYIIRCYQPKGDN